MVDPTDLQHGSGLKPCPVKWRLGQEKMKGVRGRKQLVRSPEDINLHGEGGDGMAEEEAV